MKKNYSLINNVEARQYEFCIDGYLAKIEYTLSGNGEIYFTHMKVPVELEGRGIGSELVEQSLADVETNGLKLVPLCSFVMGFIRKNPEWKRIVMKGINI